MEKLFLSLSIFLIIGAVWYGASLIAEYKKGADSYKEAEETYVTGKNQREDTEKGEEKKEGKQPGKPSEKRKKKGEDRTQAEESAQTEQPGKTAPISVDFEKLRERNPDVRGWIYIESIDLSYPVMQGTDNEYYLKHTWDGEEVFSASIFMDYRNAPDFGDYNTILYGHNMKDGSMFHKIQYCMDGEYYARSPYIWILTPEGDFRYEIFSEYDTRYDSDTYTVFGTAGESLEKYIRKMQGQSLWKSGVELGGAEHILTLSTCNGADDLRRIVQARLVE